MLFKYRATNQEGKTINGSAEAADRPALVAMLHKQGLRPVLISKDKHAGKSSGLFKPRQKIKLSDLVIFTRQLSTMITAGVPLARSLAALSADTENVYMKEVIAGITKDVESGIPLGDAFSKYPRV